MTQKKGGAPDPARQKATFVRSLTRRPNVSGAAHAAGISRKTAYEWRKADLEFAAAWQDALDATLDALEEAGMQRAEAGESDLLLMFFLKAHRPDTYRDTIRQEHSGPNGGALPFAAIEVRLTGEQSVDDPE